MLDSPPSAPREEGDASFSALSPPRITSATHPLQSSVPLTEQLQEDEAREKQRLALSSESSSSESSDCQGIDEVVATDAETDEWEEDDSGSMHSVSRKKNIQCSRKNLIEDSLSSSICTKPLVIYSESDEDEPMGKNENSIPVVGNCLEVFKPPMECNQINISTHVKKDAETESSITLISPLLLYEDNFGPFSVNELGMSSFDYQDQFDMAKSIPTPDSSPSEYLEQGGEFDHKLMECESTVESEFKNISTGVEATKVTGSFIVDLVLETKQKMDTVITLADGKLGAHRLILSAVSPFLEALLMGQDSKHTSTLILPDITKQTMELLLKLAYTGNVTYSEDEGENLFGTMKMLLFGQNMDMSLFELLPQPRPSRPPVVTPPPGGQAVIQDGPSHNGLEKADVRIEALNDERKDSGGAMNSGIDTKATKCRYCQEPIPDKALLSHHVEEKHPEMIKHAVTFSEVQATSFCDGCDTQWKTLDRAQKCLDSHGLRRCWICFDVFKKMGMRAHYMTNHCDDSSKLEAYDTFIRCRWCQTKFSITKSTSPFVAHAMTHIPQSQTAKGGKGRKSKVHELEDYCGDDSSVSLDETVSVDGKKIHLKYKTLKGKDVMELEKSLVHLEPSRLFQTEQMIFNQNWNEYYSFHIKLKRLPAEVENKLFRRCEASVPPTPETKSTLTTELITSSPVPNAKETETLGDEEIPRESDDTLCETPESSADWTETIKAFRESRFDPNKVKTFSEVGLEYYERRPINGTSALPAGLWTPTRQIKNTKGRKRSFDEFGTRDSNTPSTRRRSLRKRAKVVPIFVKDSSPKSTLSGGKKSAPVSESCLSMDYRKNSEEEFSSPLPRSSLDIITKGFGTLHLDRPQDPQKPILRCKFVMPELGSFNAVLFNVSHRKVDEPFFPANPVRVIGRIAPSTVWDYLEKMKKPKEVIILRVAPATPFDTVGFMSFFTYFASRDRLGCLGGIVSPIKDAYLVPLDKNSILNKTILPLHGQSPGLPKKRSHCLLAVVTRQK